MGKIIYRPGFYKLPELKEEDIDKLAYPVQVAKIESPHLVLLYAEDNRLQMSELALGSANFDNIKRFCMISPQEERLLCDYCQKEYASILCEVRAPEYNLTRWQEASIRPLVAVPRDPDRELRQSDTIYLESRYWKLVNPNRTFNVRTVTEPISLSLAVELAPWEQRSPGVIVADSEGELYRVASREWEVRNKLLEDLYEDLQEGRLRRLTYPRLDEREEYYRDRMRKTLEERPQVWQDLQEGRTPLWTVFHALREGHGTYDTHKLMEKMYPDLE